jgi:hypothetical protein
MAATVAMRQAAVADSGMEERGCEEPVTPKCEPERVHAMQAAAAAHEGRQPSEGTAVAAASVKAEPAAYAVKQEAAGTWDEMAVQQAKAGGSGESKRVLQEHASMPAAPLLEAGQGSVAIGSVDTPAQLRRSSRKKKAEADAEAAPQQPRRSARLFAQGKA